MNPVRMKRCTYVALLVPAALVLGFGTALPSVTAAAQETTPSSRTLKAVADEYWQHRLDDEVGLRLKYGLPIEKLPEVSLKEAESQATFARNVQEKLRDLKPEELTHEEVLSLEILRWKARDRVEGLPFYWLGFEVTPYSSPIPGANRVFTTYRFREKSDLDRYLRLLRAYPAFVRQIQAKLEGQRDRGILIPKEELELVVPFLGSFAKKGEESLFYVKSDRLPALEAAQAEAFRKELTAVIDGQIRPAFEALTTFLGGEYRSQAPNAVGLGQYPEGKPAYRYLVRLHTTLDVSPEEVHRIGLEEVERLNAHMKEVRDSIGFKGSKADFHHFLKTDPRFFPKSSDEIGDRLRRFARAIEPRIDGFFLRRPQAPYDVKRLDPALERAMTYGYYQVPTAADPKGYYLYNASNLGQRSLLNAAALTYHELVPGHHFQINLQSENEALPSFRKESRDTAYTEGWGTYAADVAEEMGMYKDPYDLYGRLLMEMFLAVRLVVDTGMNDRAWSRARAVEFMRENVQESDTQIHTESLRYSVDMPGQALAYRMGARKIVQLREKVRTALGERFDIRRFHEAVLGSGSMPMAVLERHIDAFIQKERGRAAAP